MINKVLNKIQKVMLNNRSNNKSNLILIIMKLLNYPKNQIQMIVFLYYLPNRVKSNNLLIEAIIMKMNDLNKRNIFINLLKIDKISLFLFLLLKKIFGFFINFNSLQLLFKYSILFFGSFTNLNFVSNLIIYFQFKEHKIKFLKIIDK